MKVWIWFPAAAQTQRTDFTLNRVYVTNKIYSLLFCTMLTLPLLVQLTMCDGLAQLGRSQQVYTVTCGSFSLVTSLFVF